MTDFRVKGTYYELTMYFDAWNKEILGYRLAARKGAISSYYDGFKQVLSKIKEELFIDFGLKHSNDVPNLIKLYIDYYNYERPSYALNYKTTIQYKIESDFSVSFLKCLFLADYFNYIFY